MKQVCISFSEVKKEAVFAALDSLGFVRLAGYETRVGDTLHIYGNVPRERVDAVQRIDGIINVGDSAGRNLEK